MITDVLMSDDIQEIDINECPVCHESHTTEVRIEDKVDEKVYENCIEKELTCENTGQTFYVKLRSDF